MTFKSFLMDTDPNDYLKNKIKNLKEMERLPLELKNCSCCECHKINFPSIGNPIRYITNHIIRPPKIKSKNAVRIDTLISRPSIFNIMNPGRPVRYIKR